VDIESTSTDPETARIVSAAIAYVGGGQPTETVTILADPGVEIPAQATQVHGITTEQVRAEGLPARAAVALVLEAVARRDAGTPVVIAKAPYDLTLLDREARRHELTPLSDRGELLVIDPMVIDRWLDRYRRGPRKLLDLCRHYDAKLDQAHDAAFDAIAAARVAWRIGTSADVVRRARDHDEIVELVALRVEWDRVRTNLPALHAAQIGWARQQAADLERHFAETGQPERVDDQWPILRLTDEVALERVA
jgi:DNA polymerase-3 subunit epsilon